MVNSSGRAILANGKIRIVIIIVEITNCIFKVCSMFSKVTFVKLVAKKAVRKEAQMPAAVINRGK